MKEAFPMIDLKQMTAANLSGIIPALSADEIEALLEYPPDPGMGDVALPCFQLSKVLRRSPAQIAEELAGKFPPTPMVDRVEAVNGYLNVFVDQGAFAEALIGDILDSKTPFGSSTEGNGKTVVIDFSAPNIAKPFHIGHLRSTVIGKALYNIYSYMGYTCVGINHLGDWGTQFGKLIVAFKKWGSREAVEEGLIDALMELYVKFHDEAEKNPSLDQEARQWFARMEQGDEEALSLWKWMMEISIEEFKKIYALLGVDFESWAGESFYRDKTAAVVAELNEKGLLTESEGARIVDLSEYDMPPCLIVKSDGSTLYATRDIAAAMYRKKTYDFAKCLYVVGVTQKLQLQQWFKVVEMMGYTWAKDLYHVPFGTVSLGGEKLATRKGKVVLLDELFGRAIEKTLATIEEKNPDLENKEEVARQMGVGAIVFSDLSSNRIKDVSFSWDEILNFDGETGPYVQYTHARAGSVLRKAGKAPVSSIDGALLDKPEERAVLRMLYRFPERVRQAMDEMEPSIVTRYLVDLAQDFNRFYHEHSILGEDAPLRTARIALTACTRKVLRTGLTLIGLAAPERV
jgi:arginyl-tRNA synthetase